MQNNANRNRNNHALSAGNLGNGKPSGTIFASWGNEEPRDKPLGNVEPSGKIFSSWSDFKPQDLHSWGPVEIDPWQKLGKDIATLQQLPDEIKPETREKSGVARNQVLVGEVANPTAQLSTEAYSGDQFGGFITLGCKTEVFSHESTKMLSMCRGLLYHFLFTALAIPRTA